jgi:glyoxylase-like metal-dependent hydrolase (beta-lactamase superfamily II)
VTEEILPNLYRIEVPLPGNPLKVINSYVITAKGNSLVIDTGFNRKECREALEKGLKSLDVNLDKTDFFSTHLHADHQGLIPTFAREGVKTYMGKIDAQHTEAGGGWDKMLKYGVMSGFSEGELESAVINHPGRKHGAQKMVTWTHVQEGDTITIGDYDLKCIETPGHTWGHICLYEPNKKILFSGDHILGDITPNIQVWARDDDPLKSYMESLSKVDKMDIEYTLPGHRSLIEDCGKRIQELKAHHLARCSEVIDILQEGSRNAYDTASRMTWDITAKSWDDFPLMQKWFATGEALAHLRFLEKKGFISETEQSDDVIRYSLIDGAGKLKTMDG